MTIKLLSADDFRQAAKEGAAPDATVYRFATTEPEQVGEAAARTQRFVFSDATIDHAGDSIDPKGWDLAIFKSNPVALFSHMSWEPPIGRAANVSVKDSKLVGDIEFASAEIYPFADTIYQLVKGGFLKAVSVGFRPTKWAFTNDKDRPYGIDFIKQILLEISCCCVPCNPAALSEARSLGVDTLPLVEWAEKVLDNGEVVFMPRRDVEILRLQAKGAAPTRFYLSYAGPIKVAELEEARLAMRDWDATSNATPILPRAFELCEVRKTDAADWKCGAARDLPLDEEGAWDGAAAEASIFGDGDDFDPAEVRKGFLAFDASAPKLRGSYKLPFARVTDGKLTAMASGIRAAASRLPDADISDSVKETARAVLDHYEAAMKDGDKALEAAIREALPNLSAESLRAVVGLLLAKAGRRISAATKAKMQEAIAHHAAATKCLTDAMGSDDDGDPDDPEQPDEAQTDTLDTGAQPPGAVVVESDEHLTPEERRLREVAALRADLPNND